MGYGGTKTEMERLLADAEALTGIHYDISNLGDVYEAIHVIQGELGLTGVAANEASTTFSGSFNAMKAAAANFLGSLTLGEGVSEAMSQLVTSASTFFFGNFLPMLGTLVSQLPGAIATFLQQGLPLLVSNVTSLLSSLASQISSLAQSITAEKVTAWAQSTLPKIASAGASLIGRLASSFVTNLPKIVGAIAKIGAAIVRGLGSALWGKVKAAANGIKERFLEPIEAAKEKVRGILDKIKGFFPISIGNVLSGLRLPHFSISGKFGINPPSVPHFSVSWYKKAMGEPYMFSNPTLFGAGEAGDEVLYGRKALMKDIAAATGGGSPQITNNITINGARDPMETADVIVRQMKLELRTI